MTVPFASLAATLSFTNGFDWDSFWLGCLMTISILVAAGLMVRIIIELLTWLLPHPDGIEEEEYDTNIAFEAIARLCNEIPGYTSYKAELRENNKLHVRFKVRDKKLNDYFEIPISEVDWEKATPHDLVFYQRRRIQSQRSDTVKRESS